MKCCIKFPSISNPWVFQNVPNNNYILFVDTGYIYVTLFVSKAGNSAQVQGETLLTGNQGSN